MEGYTSKDTTLRDYLRVIFRHKIVFLILPLAIMIPVYIFLEMKTPTYEASVKLYVKARARTSTDYYVTLYRPTLIEDHAQLVKSNIVLERVVKALKLYEVPIDYEMRFASKIKSKLIRRRIEKLKQTLSRMPEEKRQAFLFRMAVNRLRSNISAVPVLGLSFFRITVRDFDPVAAAIIANSVARSYVIFDLEQQIAELKLQYGEKHAMVKKLENFIEEFKETLDGRPLPDIEAMGPASIKIVKQAEIGELAGALNKRFLLILSFAASIFLGVILSFIFDYFDQTFKSPREIETFLKIPFLGSIPRKRLRKKLLTEINPKKSDYTKSYQNLSEQLSLLLRDKGIKTLLITDSEGMKDLPIIGVNIGFYLSHKTEYKVLLIDADLRRSSLSKVLKIQNNVGLIDILEKKVSLSETIRNIGKNLYILPSGNTDLNPIILLSSSMMPEIINKAKGEFDLIFVICPDLKNYIDATIISTLVDGTVLVINEGKVRRQVVENSLIPLRQKKANIIGAILNNRRYVIPKIIYKLV